MTGSELSGSHVGEAIYAEQPAVHCLPRVLPAGTWRFELWLFLSSFGVWFALLSWLQLFSPGPPVTFVCDGPTAVSSRCSLGSACTSAWLAITGGRLGLASMPTCTWIWSTATPLDPL